MNMTNKKYLHSDIEDSPEDQEKLKGDQGVLDLPELEDIPGAGRSGKNASLLPGDSTISSADEEGDKLLDDDDEPGESDITPLEKKLLSESFDPSYDTDLPIGSLSLDEKDNEGDKLEEAGQDSDLFGKDLDDELVKEEDEETEGEETEDQQ
jgi:hypothetical protein